MKQPEILQEIARIEGEIARLAGELRALRERFEAGAASSRRNTVAFSAPPPPMESPASTPAIPPPPRSRVRGRSLMPPPPPPVAVKDIQSLAVDSVPPPPEPARREHSRSSIRPIAMRGAGAAEPAPQTESPARERAEAGRYGFVSEPKARTANRAR